MILTAWEHVDDQLKIDTQEEYTCCGVDPGRQDVFYTPEGHPACNSTAVRNAVKTTCYIQLAPKYFGKTRNRFSFPFARWQKQFAIACLG